MLDYNIVSLVGEAMELDTISLIIILLFVALLVSHLCLAFWIGLRTHGPQAWKLLGGLSGAASLTWLILAFAIGIISIWPSATESWEYTYLMTFHLPLYIIPDAMVLWIPDQSIAVSLYFIITLMTLAIALYLVAMLPYALARGFLRHQGRERQQTKNIM